MSAKRIGDRKLAWWDLSAWWRTYRYAKRSPYASGGIIPSPPGAPSDQIPAMLSNPHVPLGSALVRNRDTGKLMRYDGGQWVEVPPDEWPESMRQGDEP